MENIQGRKLYEEIRYLNFSKSYHLPFKTFYKQASLFILEVPGWLEIWDLEAKELLGGLPDEDESPLGFESKSELEEPVVSPMAFPVVLPAASSCSRKLPRICPEEMCQKSRQIAASRPKMVPKWP